MDPVLLEYLRQISLTAKRLDHSLKCISLTCICGLTDFQQSIEKYVKSMKEEEERI